MCVCVHTHTITRAHIHTHSHIQGGDLLEWLTGWELTSPTSFLPQSKCPVHEAGYLGWPLVYSGILKTSSLMVAFSIQWDPEDVVSNGSEGTDLLSSLRTKKQRAKVPFSQMLWSRLKTGGSAHFKWFKKSSPQVPFANCRFSRQQTQPAQVLTAHPLRAPLFHLHYYTM